MAILRGKLGEWNVPHAHDWSERARDLKVPYTPIIQRDSRVFVVGACVSVNLAACMRRLKLKVDTHPAGHFYSSAGIRQQVEAAFGGWPERDSEPIWKLAKGYIDPFAMSHREYLPSEDEVRARRIKRDAQVAQKLREADVVAVFLEHIEVWQSPLGSTYVLIPHPEVFPTVEARFHRLTYAEVMSDLERIYAAVRQHTRAEIIFAATASWAHSTITPHDVRSASLDTTARVHAAVSELRDRHPDIHYFPLSDMVFTAEHPNDFFGEDGRHLTAAASEYMTHEFLRQFAAADVPRPMLDLSWLQAPGAQPAAARPPAPPTPPPDPLQRLRAYAVEHLPKTWIHGYRTHVRPRLPGLHR